MGRVDRIRKLTEQNTDRTGPGLPLVEIAGDRRVLIEHHRGVVAYGPCEILVRVKYGQVRVTGSGLCLAKMSAEQLVICGRIGSVELLKTGGQWNER